MTAPTKVRPAAARGGGSCVRDGRARVVGALAAVAMAGATGPAGAAGLDTSFTVLAQAGGLTVTWAASTASVDDAGDDPVFDPATATALVDDLPTLTVADDRGVVDGAWTVTASATAFVHADDPGHTVAATQARAHLDAASVADLAASLGGSLDGMTLTAAELTAGSSDLGTAYTLLAGTTPTGTGSVAVVPRLALTVPAATPAGTYTATITATVS